VGSAPGEADGPCHVALLSRQEAGGGRQRADVKGVSGGKRVEPLAGKWYAAPMSADCPPIRTFLVEDLLEQMRKRACNQRRHKNVVACEPGLRGLVVGQKPPTAG
jgi:hypothetical protein